MARLPRSIKLPIVELPVDRKQILLHPRVAQQEITAGSSRHVYGREFVINARVAAGFARIARRDFDAASEAFAAALADSPGHPKATVGTYAVAAASGDQQAIARSREETVAAIHELRRSERHAEAALVSAGAQIVQGHAAEAAAALDSLLASAPAGPAGWIIPIDPMLAAIREHPAKQALFARLAARAA